jgi:acyl carrier protein
MQTEVERVRAVIAGLLAAKLRSHGLSAVLPDDLDLRERGLVDSLGFVELLSALENRLGRRIDLSDLDPERLTNVGALARHIAAAHSDAHLADGVRSLT